MSKTPQQKKDAEHSRKGSLVICAFCRGRGVDPFGIPSQLSRCQVCKGRKENFVLEPYEECPTCLGTGAYLHHRLSCAVCKGRGRLHIIEGRDRQYGCTPENRQMLDIETGLPCLSAYDLTPLRKSRT